MKKVIEKTKQLPEMIDIKMFYSGEIDYEKRYMYGKAVVYDNFIFEGIMNDAFFITGNLVENERISCMIFRGFGSIPKYYYGIKECNRFVGRFETNNIDMGSCEFLLKKSKGDYNAQFRIQKRLEYLKNCFNSFEQKYYDKFLEVESNKLKIKQKSGK